MEISDVLKARFEDLHENDKFNEIIELANHYAFNHDNEVYLKTQIGRALNNLGREEEALVYLLEVDALEKGTNALTKYRLAYAYFYTSDFENTEKYIQECLRIEPKHPYIKEISSLLKNQNTVQQASKNNDNSPYVSVYEHDNSISVCFYIEHLKPFEIGKKMNTINELAYMNGYNWEAFLDHYLEKNHSDILVDMDADSEAGMYVAYYDDKNNVNKGKAESLMEVIKQLVENEQDIYQFLREEGNKIEWD